MNLEGIVEDGGIVVAERAKITRHRVPYNLQGDKVQNIASSQTMNVSVDSPTRVGKGLFAYIRYRVATKIGLNGAGSAGQAESNYTVYRR